MSDVHSVSAGAQQRADHTLTQPVAGVLSRLERANELDRTRKFDDASVRRSLNALAVTSSLVSALIDHPGERGEREEMVDSARRMLASADRSTLDVLEIMGIAPGEQPWAHHRVLRVVVQAIAERWRQSAAAGSASPDVSDLLPVWDELMRAQYPELVFADSVKEDELALKIAMIEGMRPVISEIAIFDFFRKPSDCAGAAAKLIAERALAGARELAGDSASPASMKMLVNSLVRNAGHLFASAWRRQATDLVSETLGQMSREQINEFVRAHPDGLSLQPIETAFLGAFSRLLETIRFLVPPRRESRPDTPSEAR